MSHAIEYPGDPRHPDHNAYLHELGATTYAAAGLAGISFDLLRIHDNVPSADLYDDPLGTLMNRLRGALKRGSALPELAAFIDELNQARVVRNDLIHALPVLHGLHRRTGKDLGRVVDFFTVESLREARERFENVRRKGNGILYFDGGAAIRAWYARTADEV
jgi:hypothetical protein